MTLPEAYEILSDHQKWRTAQPPYHIDPDADEWVPVKWRYTQAQLTEALQIALHLIHPLCTPRPPISTPSPATTGAAPSSPPVFVD